jgi:hypothetical protein
MSGKRQKINNTEAMMDALVDITFQYISMVYISWSIVPYLLTSKFLFHQYKDKRKSTKRQTTIYNDLQNIHINHTHKTKDGVTRTPLKSK